MYRTPELALIALLALTGCGTRTTSGQDFGLLQPSCVIGCRSSIEATNAHPDAVINISPRPAARPTE